MPVEQVRRLEHRWEIICVFAFVGGGLLVYAGILWKNGMHFGMHLVRLGEVLSDAILGTVLLFFRMLIRR